MGIDQKKISVILPNYNYAKYLPERITSIVNQTYPIYELIILEDCSTDNSLEVIKQEIKKYPHISMKLEVNHTNSGSVFSQWAKGISQATGDYIWIAEADDLSSLTFLEKVIAGFELDEEVILSYCQSKKINASSEVVEEDYLNHTKEIDEDKWKHNYLRSGVDEICDSLIVKCTIPNVSAVVFKNIDISPVTKDMLQYKLAGDWRFYAWILEKGKIYFNKESLNYHRFHSNSVRESINKKLDYEEFLRIQDHILNHFHINEEVQNKIQKIRKTIKKNINALEKQSLDEYLSALMKKINNYKRIGIYGTGEAAKLLIQYLSNQTLEIDAKVYLIEEIDKEKVGKTISGVTIVSLEQALSEHNAQAVIIASNLYQEVIYERIKYLETSGVRVLRMIE